MKKSYQKPEVWVETFVIDASIAAGGCGDSSQIPVNSEIMEMYKEAAALGVTEEDFNAALNAAQGTYCYHTLTYSLASYVHS